MRTLIAIILLLAGCGPHDARDRFDPNEQPVHVAAFRIHFSMHVSAPNRLKALDAVRNHWWPAIVGNIPVSLQFHLNLPGPAYPQGYKDVFVHAKPFDSPYQPQVARTGYLDGAGNIHVFLDACGNMVDFLHQVIHAFWAPLEDHNAVPALWTDVLREQDYVNRQVRIARGCP